MALFEKKAEDADVKQAVNQAVGDTSFLDDHAGVGTGDIGANAVQVPLLKILQPLSKEVVEGGQRAGDLWNTALQKSYGSKLNVVPVQFKIAWYEWLPQLKGLAGRYEVGEIEVVGDPYKGMVNRQTGNVVNETWLYAFVLPDYLSDGILLYSSTRTNIKYLKKWNTAIKQLRLPSGKPAPMFGAIWELNVGVDKNDKGQFFSFIGGIKHTGWVNKDLFTTNLLPARNAATTLSLAYVPEATEDTTSSGIQPDTEGVGTY